MGRTADVAAEHSTRVASVLQSLPRRIALFSIPIVLILLELLIANIAIGFLEKEGCEEQLNLALMIHSIGLAAGLIIAAITSIVYGFNFFRRKRAHPAPLREVTGPLEEGSGSPVSPHAESSIGSPKSGFLDGLRKWSAYPNKLSAYPRGVSSMRSFTAYPSDGTTDQTLTLPSKDGQPLLAAPIVSVKSFDFTDIRLRITGIVSNSLPMDSGEDLLCGEDHEILEQSQLIGTVDDRYYLCCVH